MPRTSSARASDLEEEAIERLLQPGEDDLGSFRHGDVMDILGQHLAGEIGDSDP